MKAQARDIIWAAGTTLQDEGVRWTAPELVSYLNDGQRQLVTVRPSETAVTTTFAPVQGGRQELPQDALTLLEVRCNSAGRMRALTLVERHMLESVEPDWASLTPTDTPVHYMYGPLEPRVFYLYRPVSLNARVELTYAKYPVDVPTPTGTTADSVFGETALDAKWANALRDYTLYRAFMKDAEYGANAALVATHRAQFLEALGVNTGHPSAANDLSR